MAKRVAKDMDAEREISRNIAAHDRVATRYEEIHGEIFNDIEQQRLATLLVRARQAVKASKGPIHALDFGTGTGNLTRHMLDLGLNVTAADISPKFLELIAAKYPRAERMLLNGRDLAAVPDESFAFIATYSVLHHIPDYLGAVRDLTRVCAPGGVVVVDHEPTPEYWLGGAEYQAFVGRASRFDWRKYTRPINYVHKVRRLFEPRFVGEGDIHVWPDDHVDWDAIKRLMAKAGFDIVIEDDYLLYKTLYRPEIYEQYRHRISDTKAMVFRKRERSRTPS